MPVRSPPPLRALTIGKERSRSLSRISNSRKVPRAAPERTSELVAGLTVNPGVAPAPVGAPVGESALGCPAGAGVALPGKGVPPTDEEALTPELALVRWLKFWPALLLKFWPERAAPVV